MASRRFRGPHRYAKAILVLLQQSDGTPLWRAVQHGCGASCGSPERPARSTYLWVMHQANRLAQITAPARGCDAAHDAGWGLSNALSILGVAPPVERHRVAVVLDERRGRSVARRRQERWRLDRAGHAEHDQPVVLVGLQPHRQTRGLVDDLLAG